MICRRNVEALAEKHIKGNIMFMSNCFSTRKVEFLVLLGCKFILASFILPQLMLIYLTVYWFMLFY